MYEFWINDISAIAELWYLLDSNPVLAENDCFGGDIEGNRVHYYKLQ